jgi:hypothetical protein
MKLHTRYEPSEMAVKAFSTGMVPTTARVSKIVFLPGGWERDGVISREFYQSPAVRVSGVGDLP